MGCRKTLLMSLSVGKLLGGRYAMIVYQINRKRKNFVESERANGQTLMTVKTTNFVIYTDIWIILWLSTQNNGIGVFRKITIYIPFNKTRWKLRSVYWTLKSVPSVKFVYRYISNSISNILWQFYPISKIRWKNAPDFMTEKMGLIKILSPVE